MRIALFSRKELRTGREGETAGPKSEPEFASVRWRICFEWPQGATGASDVEIVDYH